MPHALAERGFRCGLCLRLGLSSGHGSGRRLQRGLIHHPFASRIVDEQRLDLSPQSVISATGFGKVSMSIRRLELQRSPADAIDLVVSFRRHKNKVRIAERNARRLHLWKRKDGAIS